MARQVTPKEARRGDYIDSFTFGQKAEMLRTVDSLTRVMRQASRRQGLREREIVYTFIHPWGNPNEHLGTWQIYLLP